MDEFFAHCIDVLKTEGVAAPLKVYETFARGDTTITTVYQNLLTPDDFSELFITEAEKLEFVERDSAFGTPCRVQAIFTAWPGDKYLVFVEKSFEKMMSAFAASKTWAFNPE